MTSQSGMQLVARLWLFVLLFCSDVSGFCPKGCVCPSEIQVLCIGAGLTAPPRRLPGSVQHLSLAGNKIRRLRPSAFIKLPRLRTLVLDNNHIRRVAPFAFLGLFSLETLSLQNNPLGELTAFSLGGLRNITYLHLGHSDVRRVRPRAFSTSSDVRLLNLGGNPGVELEEGAFEGLHSVDHLLLPERLRRVEAGAFSGLRDVGALVMREPRLEAMPAGLLSGLKRVAYVSVTGGEVGSVDAGWLRGAGPLGAASITNVTIRQLGGLEIPSTVGRLTLRGNRVMSLAPRVIVTLAGVDATQVTIVDNLFPCTCQLRRLLAALDGVGYNMTQIVTENRCLTPPELLQTPISSITLPPTEVCAEQDRAEEEQRKSAEQRLRAVSCAGLCRGVPGVPLLPLLASLLLRFGGDVRSL